MRRPALIEIEFAVVLALIVAALLWR